MPDEITFKPRTAANRHVEDQATIDLKAFMGSFKPKHEEKEAICALLLSELCDHACNCADTRKDERTGPPRFAGETDTEIMPDGSIYRARHSFRVF